MTRHNDSTVSDSQKAIGSLLPRVCLVVILSEDPDAFGCVDCARGRVTIGRDDKSDLTINADEVSRVHAVVERRGDRWFVLDKSRNGTRCNGATVLRERQLEDGDRIQIGQTVIAFLCDVDDGDRTTVAEIWRSLDRGEKMPFPLAVLRHLVLSCSAPIERVRALFDAIDTALRFTAAAFIGSICSFPGRERAAMALVHATLDEHLGWERSAFNLTDLVPAGTPIAQAAKNLHAARARGALLADALRLADRVRSLITDQQDLAPTAHAEEVPFLEDILAALLAALNPLNEYRLISVARIAGFERGQIRYELHEHRGACELFPVVPARMKDILLNDWCYLRSRQGDRPPILLAPFVRYGLCSTCGRMELALAENVLFGPPGASIPLVSVVTGHPTDAEVPDHERMDAMHKAFGTPPGPVSQPRIRTLPPGPPVPHIADPETDDTGPSQSEATNSMRTPWILFLGASPSGQPDADPEEEQHQIKQALEHDTNLALRKISLHVENGVHVKDLIGLLNEHSADVLHVSAHGSTRGEIYLRDETGRSIAVEPDELASAIEEMDRPPRCVVLCACYSALGAEALAKNVGCVIGMKLEIGTAAAQSFSFGFYRALASAKSVKTAFEQGCKQIGLVVEASPVPDAQSPTLIPGTADPAQIYLIRRRTSTMTAPPDSRVTDQPSASQ